MAMNSCSTREKSILCTYQYSIWNTYKKKSVLQEPKRMSRAELPDEFKDSTGCSICEEDQEEIKLSNGIEFHLCYKYAETVKEILEDALDDGYEIQSVTGYRPSMSRGPLTYDGFRTKFSDHSFGSAIDVNAQSNGLYYNCEQWNPKCTLRIGGVYKPHEDSLSLTLESRIVKDFKDKGFIWGGEVTGKMKDFMHFSIKPL